MKLLAYFDKKQIIFRTDKGSADYVHINKYVLSMNFEFDYRFLDRLLVEL